MHKGIKVKGKLRNNDDGPSDLCCSSNYSHYVPKLCNSLMVVASVL